MPQLPSSTLIFCWTLDQVDIHWASGTELGVQNVLHTSTVGGPIWHSQAFCPFCCPSFSLLTSKQLCTTVCKELRLAMHRRQSVVQHCVAHFRGDTILLVKVPHSCKPPVGFPSPSGGTGWGCVEIGKPSKHTLLLILETNGL